MTQLPFHLAETGWLISAASDRRRDETAVRVLEMFFMEEQMAGERNRARERADAQFNQVAAPATAAERANADYAAVGDAIRNRTSKLRAERLAREAGKDPAPPTKHRRTPNHES